MYCESIRLGSIANTETEQHTTIAPARANPSDRHARRPGLREVFEFVDDNFTTLPQRILVAWNQVNLQLYFFPTRHRHTRSKFVLSYNGARCTVAQRTGRCEGHASRFPSHGIRQRAGWSLELIYISGNIKRLNAILRIVRIGGISPPAHLDVHFTVILISVPLVEGIHAKNRG